MTLLRVLDYLLPSQCIECQRPGSMWCTACRASLPVRPRAFLRHDIQAQALVDFDSRVAGLLHAYKDKRFFVLAEYLAGLLLPIAEPLLSSHDLICWAPSNAAATRKRGFVPSELIARKLVALARTQQSDTPAALPGIRLVRRVRDQATLSVIERAANLSYSMRASPAVFGKSVLVIDDVATTGATMVEMRRALLRAGAVAVSFLVFAETIRKTPAKFQKKV